MGPTTSTLSGGTELYLDSMTTTDIPSWHQDEQRFLAEAGVVAFNTGRRGDGLTFVKKRWIHKTLRQVYISDNGYVIKRYSHFPGRRDFRMPWRREHRALCRLVGLNVPTSRGHVRVRHGDGVVSYTFVRTLLPGDEMHWKAPEQVTQLAELMAAFHHHDVVTLDPGRDNFVQGKDGRIGFIDFGRARVFVPGSPLAPPNMAKDLYRLMTYGGLDDIQFSEFLAQYRELLSKKTPILSAITLACFRFICIKNHHRLPLPRS